MLNLDPGKLLVIAVVAVIVLGPDKLPHFARQVGGAWRSFNDFRQRMESEVRSNIPDLPSTSEIARIARNPNALLNHLGNMSSSSGGTTSGDSIAHPVMSTQPESIPNEPSMSWVTRALETDGESESSAAPVVPASAPSTQASPVFSGDANLN